MTETELHLEVDIGAQRMRLFEGGSLLHEYHIATASNGPGELNGSECTPRGHHIIRAKVGSDAAINSIFIGRRQTGEIFSEAMRVQHPKRDWILTRILWLSGKEPGRNRLGQVDTMRRYIYIHGCPDADPMGAPSSHGCVKMRNQDIIDLFERVPVGTPVYIHE